MCNRRASRAVCDFCSSRPAASVYRSTLLCGVKNISGIPSQVPAGWDGRASVPISKQLCQHFWTSASRMCSLDSPTEASRNWAGEESSRELTYWLWSLKYIETEVCSRWSTSLEEFLFPPSFTWTECRASVVVKSSGPSCHFAECIVKYFVKKKKKINRIKICLQWIYHIKSTKKML